MSAVSEADKSKSLFWSSNTMFNVHNNKFSKIKRTCDSDKDPKLKSPTPTLGEDKFERYSFYLKSRSYPSFTNIVVLQSKATKRNLIEILDR
jgi:hypothetical protein